MSNILLSRYQIIRSLASGGFGDTYLAQDIALPGNPFCVVKHLKPKGLSSQALPIAKSLFEREAECLYQLGEHPQIPRLYAHFQEEEEFYLVQEFVAGNELSQELIAGQSWSEEQTIQLLREILAVVHQKNVIHRDIKPSNIMRRQQDKKLVLIDFGAVKEFSSLTVTTGGQTSLTVAIGTPGYMPPEQAHGKPTLASDIYAVGMIAIQALTGVNPSQLPTESQTGEIIWRNQVTVSDRLATILNKMIHEYHRLRYQNATEALQDLNSFSYSNPTLVISPNTNSSSQKPVTNNKILAWILGGMGGLALAGIGGIILNRFLSNPSLVTTTFPTPYTSPVETPQVTLTPSPLESPETISTPSPTPSISSSPAVNVTTWRSDSGQTQIPKLDTICWGNNQINSAATIFNSPRYQGSLNFNNPKTDGCMPGDTLTGTFELYSNEYYCTGQITVTWSENNNAHLEWLINNLGTNCPVNTDKWEIDTYPVKA